MAKDIQLKVRNQIRKILLTWQSHTLINSKLLFIDNGE